MSRIAAANSARLGVPCFWSRCPAAFIAPWRSRAVDESVQNRLHDRDHSV